MAHPSITPKHYLLIYVALVGLTFLTVALNAYAHLGALELFVALTIATIKTVLVILFFMHLIHSDWLSWIVLVAGVIFLAIMLLGTWHDYWTRSWIPV